MADRQDGSPRETEENTQGSWESSPAPAPASDQKTVPDGPPSPRSTTRVLGPGSLAGTLCADPEMRFTQNGKALVKVRVATAKRVQNPESGQWQDGPTEYVDVTCWAGQGERVTEHLRKGDRVVVNGIWQEERWRGRDEEWHTRHTLTARDIGPSLMFRAVRVIRDKEGS